MGSHRYGRYVDLMQLREELMSMAENLARRQFNPAFAGRAMGRKQVSGPSYDAYTMRDRMAGRKQSAGAGLDIYALRDLMAGRKQSYGPSLDIYELRNQIMALQSSIRVLAGRSNVGSKELLAASVLNEAISAVSSALGDLPDKEKMHLLRDAFLRELAAAFPDGKATSPTEHKAG